MNSSEENLTLNLKHFLDTFLQRTQRGAAARGSGPRCFTFYSRRVTHGAPRNFPIDGWHIDPSPILYSCYCYLIDFTLIIHVPQILYVIVFCTICFDVLVLMLCDEIQLNQYRPGDWKHILTQAFYFNVTLSWRGNHINHTLITRAPRFKPSNYVIKR